eukprot:SAG11_NODE_26573_length_343_cov_1.057377_1_plen_51_part_10
MQVVLSTAQDVVASIVLPDIVSINIPPLREACEDSSFGSDEDCAAGNNPDL